MIQSRLIFRTAIEEIASSLAIVFIVQVVLVFALNAQDSAGRLGIELAKGHILNGFTSERILQVIAGLALPAILEVDVLLAFGDACRGIFLANGVPQVVALVALGALVETDEGGAVLDINGHALIEEVLGKILIDVREDIRGSGGLDVAEYFVLQIILQKIVLFALLAEQGRVGDTVRDLRILDAGLSVSLEDVALFARGALVLGVKVLAIGEESLREETLSIEEVVRLVADSAFQSGGVELAILDALLFRNLDAFEVVREVEVGCTGETLSEGVEEETVIVGIFIASNSV